MLPLVYSPAYVTPLPDGHRFPMPKFGALRDLLVEESTATPEQFHCPAIGSFELITSVHDPAYAQSFFDGSIDRDAIRKIGLPWSKQLVRRTRTAIAGTLLTCELALEHGLACNTAGGTHHAHRAFGSGFCIFNDMAVSARTLADRGSVDHVLIIDLDVHHGDGTATIFANDPRVFTFSMHCEKNFPAKKPPSDLDVPLAKGVGDQEYLDTLQQNLPRLLEQVEPDMVIYDAGVDVHRDDRLGHLGLTDEGLYGRDKYVIEQCRSHHIPTACVIGGGYDADHTKLANRHATVHRAAAEVWRVGLLTAR
ncbi:MAG: histone deacetylase [Phycisphaeraceae bacterium]|nr:histone deacetylase [Phycisphaeraceae bacterium]